MVLGRAGREQDHDYRQCFLGKPLAVSVTVSFGSFPTLLSLFHFLPLLHILGQSGRNINLVMRLSCKFRFLTDSNCSTNFFSTLYLTFSDFLLQLQIKVSKRQHYWYSRLADFCCVCVCGGGYCYSHCQDVQWYH